MLLSSAFRFNLLATLASVGLLGFVFLANYSSRPGEIRPGLKTLPASELANISGVDPNAPTIVLLYHPKCPCTMATLRNLERLKSTFKRRPNLLAYAFCPNSEPTNWIDGANTQAVNRLLGSPPQVDFGGIKSEHFGAAVSGHVLVYNPARQLTFFGGITAARGHEGQWAATSQLTRCINNPDEAFTRWPVFGCPLASQTEVEGVRDD